MTASRVYLRVVTCTHMCAHKCTHTYTHVDAHVHAPPISIGWDMLVNCGEPENSNGP